ncbi:MAG TPA: 4Fe-4S binding protein [Clostridiales bacterium]|nr:4Fe-4S binding protein [Clostridiales bacterium]
MNRYKDLSIKADNCNECGICSPKCPYDIDIIRKLSICDYKLGEKEIY